MKFFRLLCLLLPLSSAIANEGVQSDDLFSKLQWHAGPAIEKIADKAVLKTDANLLFLDETNSQKFLELTGNIPEPGHYIVLSKENDWWAVFSFDPVGYIKDDEKIDATALLEDLKSSDEAANEERKKLGLAAVTTEGWYIAPHYDPATKHLEWGLKLMSEGEVALNYTVRLLGRTGVMSATLVSSPEALTKDMQDFKKTLTNFEFVSGERYSEFKQGDKIAEYGLAALVAGGAAAIAAKSGFWKVIVGFFAAFWKIIAVVAVAVFAGIKSLFSRKKNNE